MLKLMKVLYDCGTIANDEIEVLGLDESIVDELLRKEQLVAKMVGNKVLYFLTDYGEKVYRINTNKKLFFRCANKEKMASLVKFYATLSPEERDSWKSKDCWYFEGFVGAIPDATYLKDGKMHAVYVTNKNTTKELVANIEAFLREIKVEKMNYIR